MEESRATAMAVVGPVIGKVTATTARVLLESDEPALVRCIAEPERPGTDTASASVRLGRYRPGVLVLDGLVPDTRYHLAFQGIEVDLPSSVRTFARQPDHFNIAAVSCNFAVRRGDSDLWSDLHARFVERGKIDLVMHLGDQIYGDNAFAEGQYLWQRVRRKRARKLILERYRQLYRMTWADPSTRLVLANTSNLMIWDDHEIRDDWGSRPGDSNSKSADFQIGRLARRVYREYQRQLWSDDAVGKPKTPFEDHYHSWGSVGAVFVDQRGGRSFHRDRVYPYLGAPQWRRLRGALQPEPPDDPPSKLDTDGIFEECRVLVVATSVPLAYLGPATSTHGSNIVDDLEDHWSYGRHRTEQIEMLRLLRRWKERGRGERDVLVLGGDVHLGALTDIRHQDETIFQQLIASPITNAPPSWAESLGLRVLLSHETRLSPSYSIQHRDLRSARNYGLALIQPSTAGGPSIQPYVVRP